MRTFEIDYHDAGKVKTTTVRAVSSIKAVKSICERLRRNGRTVVLKVKHVREVRV